MDNNNITQKYINIQSPFIQSIIDEIGLSNREYLEKIVALRKKIINGESRGGFYASISYNWLKGQYPQEYLQLLKEIYPKQYEEESKEHHKNIPQEHIKKEKTKFQKMNEIVVGPKLFCEYCGDYVVLSPCYSCLHQSTKFKNYCRGCGEDDCECKNEYEICKQPGKEKMVLEIDKIITEQRTKAYFKRCSFTQLPDEISRLTSLTELHLYNNRLTKLDRIERLTNLTNLDLCNNQLTQIPTEIGQLINLRILDLSDNQLARLPNEISQLTNLATLHLQNNQLVRLPAKIKLLTNLTKLDLRDNPLSKRTVQRLKKVLPNCEIIF